MPETESIRESAFRGALISKLKDLIHFAYSQGYLKTNDTSPEANKVFNHAHPILEQLLSHQWATDLAHSPNLPTPEDLTQQLSNIPPELNTQEFQQGLFAGLELSRSNLDNNPKSASANLFTHYSGLIPTQKEEPQPELDDYELGHQTAVQIALVWNLFHGGHNHAHVLITSL